jgi:hypothetical protein
MSILSWRGTPKPISFTKQNWHFWVLMILWAFSLEGEPAVATLRAPPSAGGRFQFHAATKSCHSWGSVPPFWYFGEKHEGHEGAWNQIFIDSGSILGSTPIHKPLVLHSKTDILKISIRRKRILESRNYHFVGKWIWETQNSHVVEQKDLGKSRCPFRRKKKGCGKVSMFTSSEKLEDLPLFSSEI